MTDLALPLAAGAALCPAGWAVGAAAFSPRAPSQSATSNPAAPNSVRCTASRRVMDVAPESEPCLWAAAFDNPLLESCDLLIVLSFWLPSMPVEKLGAVDQRPDEVHCRLTPTHLAGLEIPLDDLQLLLGREAGQDSKVHA